MADRPLPDRPPAGAPRASSFGRLWRWFLPGAIVMMMVAILQGVVDSDGGPVMIFAGGVLIAVIGVASLIRHLIDQGRAEIARREAKWADRNGENR